MSVELRKSSESSASACAVCSDSASAWACSFTDFADFFGGSGLLLRRRSDFFGAFERLQRRGVRLFGAGRDFGHALDDDDDVAGDLLELRRDGLALLHFGSDRFGGGVDAFGDRLHIDLDLPDEVGDLLGRFFGRFGERAHFVGDDGEALAVLAGAGRLDGRVEGEQIGLIGDAGDGLDDVADVGGLLLQLGDELDRAG